MLDAVMLDFPMLKGLLMHFKCLYQVHTRDRAGGNLRAERMFHWASQTYAWTTLLLGFFCGVHIVNTACGLSMALFSDTVSATIAFALLCKAPGCFGKLLMACKTVLRQRVDVLVGGVPPATTAMSARWTDTVLQAFIRACPGAQSELRAVTLKRLFRGSWQGQRIPVYFAMETTEEEAEALLEEWLDEAVDALLPHKVKVFARSRWVTSCKTSADMYILTQVNNLLPDFIKELLRMLKWTLTDRWDNINDPELMAVVAVSEKDTPNSFWEKYGKNARQQTQLLARDPDVGFDTILWLHGLLPIVELMQHMLFLGSTEFDDLQASMGVLGHGQTFRVTEACTGGPGLTS